MPVTQGNPYSRAIMAPCISMPPLLSTEINKNAKAKEEQEANVEDGAESDDERGRPGATEPGSSTEATQESSPDIKRLGLN